MKTMSGSMYVRGCSCRFDLDVRLNNSLHAKVYLPTSNRKNLKILFHNSFPFISFHLTLASQSATERSREGFTACMNRKPVFVI